VMSQNNQYILGRTDNEIDSISIIIVAEAIREVGVYKLKIEKISCVMLGTKIMLNSGYKKARPVSPQTKDQHARFPSSD